MKYSKFLAVVGAIAFTSAASGVALAARSGPAVKVEVKSLTKTLLSSTGVHGEKGSITKGGTPSGKCPASGVAGALDAATHHRWAGKWYSSVPGIFITSILGVKPKSPDYWSIVVNGKTASKGICSMKLRAGETLLFKEVK